VHEVVRHRFGAGAQACRRHHRHAEIGERERRLAGQARVGLLRRAADEEALPAGDADVLRHAEVLGVLEALGDHQRAAVLGDMLDRAQEVQLDRVGGDAGDEMLVRLDELGLQFRPQPQAREALAQVVDRHAEAHRAVQHERLVDEAEIDGGIVLGQLDHHPRGIQVEAREEARHARLLQAALHDQLR
jgi:hypothetical protein